MTKINQLIKFKPILKEKIWGGDKLCSLLNKKPERKNIGESWEISNIKENISIASNNYLKGKDLQELISEYKSELVGKKVYDQFGNNFPLLIKFIDAKDALSIQLHPNAKLAKERHESFGKAEMWYVMQADINANLIVGFKEKTSKEEYLHHLKNKSLVEILNVEEVKKGDAYFISPGTVHAVGAGVLLAEIQQTSDVTYRIYDWDRKNRDGIYRDLHTSMAFDAIDYSSKKTYKSNYKIKESESIEVITCPYFTTNIISLEEDSVIHVNNTSKDSFVIYMCVKGSCVFSTSKHTETLKMGETLLVPACIKEVQISSEEKTELLEIYIK